VRRGGWAARWAWGPDPFVLTAARPCLPRYLLSHGANIAADNSDWDLPLDLAETDAMEALLKAEIARRGGPGAGRRAPAAGASVAKDPDPRVSVWPGPFNREEVIEAAFGSSRGD